MQLKTIENKACTEPCITVEYSEMTPPVERVIGYVHYIARQNTGLSASADGEFFSVDPAEVLYIESIDRKTFLYTEAKVYETGLKLYELEGAYAEYMRASKNSIINIERIRSIRPEFGARLLATMDNGEKLFVSRQYAAVLKEKLGLGGAR